MAKGDIISRLKLESGEFDSKIKRAGQELLAYSEHCRKMGLEMGYANRDAKDFAKALGSMATVSQTARGKISELSEAFVNAKVMYKNMTDEEKKGEFGKNLAASLDQLKSRMNSAKQDLADVNKELAGGGKFGEFGNVLDTLGSKLGVTGNLTEMLTSKTALLTGAVGAGIAIVTKATEAWAGYNAELAKQDQITTVTTGLKGDDADRMTDKMRALSDTYNVDFREAVNAANTLMTQFGKSGDEATQLIKDGMQGMIQGDGPKLLSMIQQYAPAFRDAGVSASQLVAVIQNSEGGIFTDQNMNAIVMGIKNIRLMTKATSDALAQLGIDGEKMSKQLSDGSLTVFDALKQVAAQLQTVDSNSKTAGEVMQQVFGRQGVTAGTNLAKAIETLNTNLDETKRQTGEVGQSLADLQTANEKLNKAIRDCFEYDGWDQMANGIKTNLVTALAGVLDLIGKIKGALGGFSANQQQGDTRNGGGANLDRMIANLGDGKSNGKKVIYQKQIQQFSGQIFRINDQIADLQRKAGEDMDGNLSVVYEKQIRDLENRKKAVQQNMAEYERRAHAIFSGANVTKVNLGNNLNVGEIGGKGGKSGIQEDKDEFVEIIGLVGQAQERVSDLQKRMRESWDQNEIATLRKQLKEAQNDLDVLQGKLPKDSAVELTITANDTDALQKVKDIDGVTIDPKTFSITATDKALPLLREIEGVTIDPKTFSITATDKALPLLREIEGVTIDPKTVTVTADTSEALQKVQDYIAEVDGKIVNINVVPVLSDADIDKQIQKQFGKAIEVPIVPKTMGQEMEQSIHIKLAEQNMDADIQTLRTLLETQIKYGIDEIDIPTDMLMQKIVGEGMNIPDEYWANLQDQMNKKLKEMGTESIDIDFKTGKDKGKKDDKNDGKDPTVKALEKFNGNFSQVTGGIGNIVNGIQQLGIELPQGIQDAVSVLTGISSIVTGITSVLGLILVAQQTTAAASWVDAIVPFANGGIVPHAANGYFIPGNSFSGDTTPIMANAGELVLNRAQQGNLASQLTGGGGILDNLHLETYVDGRALRIVLNNESQGRMKGKYVTSTRVR